MPLTVIALVLKPALGAAIGHTLTALTGSRVRTAGAGFLISSRFLAEVARTACRRPRPQIHLTLAQERKKENHSFEPFYLPFIQLIVESKLKNQNKF